MGSPMSDEKQFDPIQDLLDEVTDKQQEDAHWEAVKNKTRDDSRIVHLDLHPDALVLITLVARCRGCGMEYVYPNKHLMIRYNHNLLKHKPSITTIGLPREVKEIRYEVDFCDKCFGVADLLGEEDETSSGN